MGSRLFRDKGWLQESFPPVFLSNLLLMLALPWGWTGEVPFTAEAGDIRKNKVATIQDAGSAHDGDHGWAG